MNKVFTTILVCGTVIMSSCIKLLPGVEQRPQKINLSYLQVPSVIMSKTAAAPTIKITKPTCSEYLNGVRIGFKERRQQVDYADYLSNVEWQETLPMLVQDHLAQLLKASGRYKAVALTNDKFPSAYLLQTHIDHFSVDKKDDHSTATITMTMTLIKTADHSVISQKTIFHTTAVDQESMVNFIHALNQAFTNFQTSVLDWLKLQL